MPHVYNGQLCRGNPHCELRCGNVWFPLVPHWDVLSIAWKCSKYRFWVCSNDLILRTSPLWRFSDFFSKWCSKYLSVAIYIYISTYFPSFGEAQPNFKAEARGWQKGYNRLWHQCLLVPGIEHGHLRDRAIGTKGTMSFTSPPSTLQILQSGWSTFNLCRFKQGLTLARPCLTPHEKHPWLQCKQVRWFGVLVVLGCEAI